MQYFWLLLAAALAMLGMGKPVRALLFGILSAVNLATIVPIYLPPRRSAPDAAEIAPQKMFPLRVLTFNVRASNSQYDEALKYLQSRSPDVIVVQEISPAWSQALERLKPGFSHQHHVPRDDNFGIALLSRIPWSSVETEILAGAGVPSLVARYREGDATWTIVGTHPVPPGSAVTSRERNEQLTALAKLIRRESGTVILAGDLNVTSWSPYFWDLMGDAGLQDSRQGFGVHCSWASRIPLTDLPLDHVLVSPGIVVQDRSVGPHLGSDHRPVVVDLLLPKQ